MALQTSGAISLLDIQNEFGGSNPIGINEYYGRHPNIPASGQISFDDFYGTSAEPTTLVNISQYTYGTSPATSSGTWEVRSFGLSSTIPVGTRYRIVIRYKTGNSSSFPYEGDLQLAQAYTWRIGTPGSDYRENVYDVLGDWQHVPSSDPEGASSTYNSSANWQNVSIGTTQYQWNARNGATTPTTNTGIMSSYGSTGYFYTETSGSATYTRNRYFWLRGPLIVATQQFDRCNISIAGTGRNFSTFPSPRASIIATVAI